MALCNALVSGSFLVAGFRVNWKKMLTSYNTRRTLDWVQAQLVPLENVRDWKQPVVVKLQSAFVPRRKLPAGPGERSLRAGGKKQVARGEKGSEQIPY